MIQDIAPQRLLVSQARNTEKQDARPHQEDDPSPWLAVSDALKAKNKARPYDPKKSVWVPNKADGGYLEGMLESKDRAKVTVTVNGEKKVFKEDAVCQITAPD